MKAVVITRRGGPRCCGSRTAPIRPSGRVRCGSRSGPRESISLTDWRGRASTPDAPSPPCVVGYEVGGEVEADFEAEVRRITGGEGIDAAFDALGPKSFRKDHRLLRPGGRLVMCGFSESDSAGGRNLGAMLGTLARMSFASVPWWKSLALISENKGVFGLNMLSWWEKEGLDRVLKPLREALAAGDPTPVVSQAFAFERAADAHRLPPSAATSARSC